MIMTLVQQFSQAIVPSIGNLVSLTSVKKSKEIYDRLDLLNYFIYGFCAICFFTLLNPFIEIWIGKEYLFSTGLVGIIVFNFYLNGMRQNVLAFRNALGLFWNDRYKPLIEAAINLLVSVMLAKSFGIAGVFIGTMVSTVMTSMWIEPFVLYKNYFRIRLTEYWLRYVFQMTLVAAQCTILHFLTKWLFHGTVGSFIVLTIVCAMFSVLTFLTVFWRTPEFRYLLDTGRKLLKRKG